MSLLDEIQEHGAKVPEYLAHMYSRVPGIRISKGLMTWRPVKQLAPYWVRLAKYWAKGKTWPDGHYYSQDGYSGLCAAILDLGLPDDLARTTCVWAGGSFAAPATTEGAVIRIRFCLRQAGLQVPEGCNSLTKLRKFLLNI